MRSLKSYVLLGVGYASLAFGIIGLFMPLIPTTPFLLLAAAAFLRSSKRLHEWMITHPRFGCYIQDYEEGRGASARAKAVAVGVLWFSILGSTGVTYWRIGRGGVWTATTLFLLAVGTAVTFYLLVVLPTARQDSRCAGGADR